MTRPWHAGTVFTVLSWLPGQHDGMTPHDPRTDHPGWARHPGVRSGPLLTTGERTADLVLRIAGTWRYLLVLAVAILVAAAAAVWHDRRAGAVVLLSLVLSAAALIEVSLVLMAGRRAERNITEATCPPRSSRCSRS